MGDAVQSQMNLNENTGGMRASQNGGQVGVGHGLNMTKDPKMLLTKSTLAGGPQHIVTHKGLRAAKGEPKSGYISDYYLYKNSKQPSAEYTQGHYQEVADLVLDAQPHTKKHN